MYLMEGNDYMCDKIQRVIDETIKANAQKSMNEVVEDEDSEDQICD